jgi:hypothetical protein
MRTTTAAILAIGLSSILSHQSEAQNQTPSSGLRLNTANRACGAVTAESADSFNPNPSDLNDGDLDDAETAAIQEGCTLRATARDAGGTPQTDIQLRLVRAAAPSGEFEPFGYPRTTDAQGNATWRFQPSPNTDYIYEVVSAAPGQQGARSNSIEIQLCTGEDSVGAIEGAPTTDSGRGCEELEDGRDEEPQDGSIGVRP